MRVTVKGKLDAGVAEQVLDELRVRAAREQQGGACVPQIVPPNSRQLHTPEKQLEVAVDYVLSVERGTLTCGEHEVRVFVCPYP